MGNKNTGQKRTMSKGVRTQLYAARVNLGLTIKEVADMVGIHEGYMLHIENGGSTPSLVVAISIMKALNLNGSLYDLPNIWGCTDVTLIHNKLKDMDN